MAIALSIFGAAYAGCFVWLAIRVIRRRERWAKWTLGIMVALAVIALVGCGLLAYAIREFWKDFTGASIRD